MPRKKLGLIHTSPMLIQVFHKLCQELLPRVDVFNIADDSLIPDLVAWGTLTPHVSRRLYSHVQCAELAGADLIMVTCSSVGAAVEASQAFTSVPVVRVDHAMADHAVSIGKRIGVLATLSTTLAPTVELLERRAMVAGKAVEVTARLCDGAYNTLLAGDADSHDRAVREQLAELIQSVDAIVLAQASMARIVSQLPAESMTKPILTSPRMAIESLIARIA